MGRVGKGDCRGQGGGHGTILGHVSTVVGCVALENVECSTSIGVGFKGGGCRICTDDGLGGRGCGACTKLTELVKGCTDALEAPKVKGVRAGVGLSSSVPSCTLERCWRVRGETGVSTWSLTEGKGLTSKGSGKDGEVITVSTGRVYPAKLCARL